MDGQSEQGIAAPNIEKQPKTSTHIATLADLSSRFFKPMDTGHITTEIDTTKKQMQPLLQAVSNRYEEDQSTIRENLSLMESFYKHNNEVLESAVFYANLFGLSEGQHITVAASAVLHDIAKADPAPANIPDALKSEYILLMHPEMGASLASSLFKNQPKLDQIVEGNNTADVAEAIRCHSGPIPGFMQSRLDHYNSHTDTPIHLDEIDPTHTPSIILLAADMLALGSPAGVEKIVKLRESAPHFRVEDITATIQEQRATTQEVRVNSALKSAYEGAAMVHNLMKMNPLLKDYADNNYQLMHAYFEKTKAEILVA